MPSTAVSPQNEAPTGLWVRGGWLHVADNLLSQEWAGISVKAVTERRDWEHEMRLAESGNLLLISNVSNSAATVLALRADAVDHAAAGLIVGPYAAGIAAGWGHAINPGVVHNNVSSKWPPTVGAALQTIEAAFVPPTACCFREAKYGATSGLTV